MPLRTQTERRKIEGGQREVAIIAVLADGGDEANSTDREKL